jgi:hypothetical protein
MGSGKPASPYRFVYCFAIKKRRQPCQGQGLGVVLHSRQKGSKCLIAKPQVVRLLLSFLIIPKFCILLIVS